MRQTADEMRQRCYDAHNGYYSYENADFQHSTSKVSITCPVHGTFEQTTNKHYKGRGCRECFYARNATKYAGVSVSSIKATDITGYRFGPDERLEVLVCVQDAKKSAGKLYSVKCHECSKDSEMFGDGCFTMSREQITNRDIPCGCAPIYKPNEQQMKIIATRYTEGKTFKFLGFEGQYAGFKTMLRFKCDIDGHEWSRKYQRFTRDTACFKCGRIACGESNRIDDDVYAEKLLSYGAYEKGTTLRRTRDESNTWYLTCPTCSKDGQEFRTNLSSLVAGFKPCFCGSPGGYDKSKDGYFYVIRAVSDESEFTGYGITNKPTTRLSQHKNNLAKKGFVIAEIELFDMSGQKAPELENAVKQQFPLNKQDIAGFRKEATYHYLYNDVVAFAEDFIC
jgi:hypothetical protein